MDIFDKIDEGFIYVADKLFNLYSNKFLKIKKEKLESNFLLKTYNDWSENRNYSAVYSMTTLGTSLMAITMIPLQIKEVFDLFHHFGDIKSMLGDAGIMALECAIMGISTEFAKKSKSTLDNFVEQKNNPLSIQNPLNNS